MFTGREEDSMKTEYKASNQDLGYRLNVAKTVVAAATRKAETLQNAYDLHENLIKAKAGLAADSELFILLDNAAHFIDTCKV